MRILQVVTLVSPDGAYGGPVRVAVNQSRALRELGHDVMIAAATRGYADPPADMDGVRLQLFPAGTAVPGIGFAGMRARGMGAWLRRHLAEFDVAHIHLARDFVTLPAARLAAAAGVPVLAQPHGMIVRNSTLLARPLDRFATVPALRAARTVFHLTAREAVELAAVGGAGLPLAQLHNGVPAAEPAAATPDRTPEVLFLARLHPRKRPELFVRMARELIDAGVDARFTLVGPDEGAARPAAAEIAAAGLEARVRYEGAVPPGDALARMGRATVYVLPSVDEPYPMSVLEAMSLGLPVVVTDTCGLAELIADSGCGVVVGPDLASLVDAVGGLLADPARAREMGAAGRAVARLRLGMDAVARQLESAYAAARAA